MCMEINVWDQILLVEFEKFSLNLSWEFKFGFGGSEQSASKFSLICRENLICCYRYFSFLTSSVTLYHQYQLSVWKIGRKWFKSVLCLILYFFCCFEIQHVALLKIIRNVNPVFARCSQCVPVLLKIF